MQALSLSVLFGMYLRKKIDALSVKKPVVPPKSEFDLTTLAGRVARMKSRLSLVDTITLTDLCNVLQLPRTTTIGVLAVEMDMTKRELCRYLKAENADQEAEFLSYIP